MFQSIQVSSGYSMFRMNSDVPLDALLKLGNRFTAPFGGFIEAENIIGLKNVELVDIKYFFIDKKAEVLEYVIQKTTI